MIMLLWRTLLGVSAIATITLLLFTIADIATHNLQPTIQYNATLVITVGGWIGLAILHSHLKINARIDQLTYVLRARDARNRGHIHLLPPLEQHTIERRTERR